MTMSRMFLALAGAMLCLHSPSYAQGGKLPAGRVPILVALVSGGDGGAVVQQARHAGVQYSIVLTEETATPAQLAVAAIAITARMDVAGDHTPYMGMLRANDDATAPAQEVAAAAKVLAVLRAQERVPVEGIGMARTTFIYLPAKATRDKMRASGRQRFGRP